MSRTPVDLLPLLCGNCGNALDGTAESALFVCPSCGLVHEPGENGLESFPAVSAAITTKLLYKQEVRYLAFWRLPAPDWQHINLFMPQDGGHLYVPAFSLTRPVVQKLGSSLCMTQPALDLREELPTWTSSRPALAAVQDDRSAASFLEGPGFGAISPVLVGRNDLKAFAEFVYLAVELGDGHELRSLGADIAVQDEELVFLPAVWDTRYVRDSYWRFLLAEFDDLVA